MDFLMNEIHAEQVEDEVKNDKRDLEMFIR